MNIDNQLSFFFHGRVIDRGRVLERSTVYRDKQICAFISPRFYCTNRTKLLRFQIFLAVRYLVFDWIRFIHPSSIAQISPQTTSCRFDGRSTEAPRHYFEELTRAFQNDRPGSAQCRASHEAPDPAAAVTIRQHNVQYSTVRRVIFYCQQHL